MKTKILTSVILSGLLFSSAVLADDDCVDPVTDWKPREVLRQQLEQRGWTIQRIKVEDGCYQVRGIDRHGNKLQAVYAPASLRILRLKINFSDGGDASDYLDPGKKPK